MSNKVFAFLTFFLQTLKCSCEDSSVESVNNNATHNSTLMIFILTNQDFIAIVGKFDENYKGCQVQRATGHLAPTIKLNQLHDFISGGVVCFWGGIVMLGLLFMLALMAKNYLMKNIYEIDYDE